MGNHSVGKSSYGDLRGLVQSVASLIVAQQVASLCYEFDTQFPGARARGDRLTVNEGIRSKKRMEVLRAAWEHYQRYGTPWAALAAALYLSTHREEIGTALDFGITTKDGSNRAMTAAEAAWVHTRGPARGIVWTGRLFNPQESWHHNGGYEYTLPPIVGVNLPGEPLYTDTTPEPAAPAPRRRDSDDMQVAWNDKHTQALISAGSEHVTINKDTPTRNNIGWKKQITLCERYASIDPRTSYPGGLLDAELAVVRVILNSMKKG